jgi:hypothetical protein
MPPVGLRTSRSSLCAMLLALAGCGGLEPVKTYDPIIDPELLFMSLTLDHDALNLSTVAPYNSIQLTATPRNASGLPMSGLPAPTFRSSDTTRVWVTATGLVQARRAATGTRVIAELVADGNVRQVDTVLVNVTTLATPPVLDSLSLPPSPTTGLIPQFAGSGVYLELAGGEFNPFVTVRARAFNTAGGEITGLAINYQSLDPSVGEVFPSNGEVSPVITGQFRLVARTTAYGVTKADTVTVTITPPVYQGIQLMAGPSGTPIFQLTDVTIKQGGFVFWINISGQPADVTFDDPANVTEAPPPVCNSVTLFKGDPASVCGTGNIPAFADTDQPITDVRMRRFLVPGIYAYRTSTGATGRVVVVP